MTFRVVSVRVGYGSGRVDFGSTNFWLNTLVTPKQATLWKISGRVWFGSGQFGFRVRFRVSIFRVSGRVGYGSGPFGSGFGSRVSFARSNLT